MTVRDEWRSTTRKTLNLTYVSIASRRCFEKDMHLMEVHVGYTVHKR